jgi:AraC-like DNA-binding protein
MDKDVNNKILDYINRHLNENLDVNKIASISGYSKFHLERIFATENGCTIYKYIKMKRLEEAAKQLTCSDLPILDIALNAGYESQQAFTLAFRKVYNLTPKVYRDKYISAPLTIHAINVSSLKSALSYNTIINRKEVYAA